MKSIGIQHIAEFINCAEETLLFKAETVQNLVLQAIEHAGMSLIKIDSHQFEPAGVTAVAIISESHIGVHTYPEARQLSLDLYTCASAEKNEAFIGYLKTRLQPEFVRTAVIQRGNLIGLKNQNWISSYSEYGFEVRYYINHSVFASKSPFQKIEIVDNEQFGRMLFLNNDLQTAESDVKIYQDALFSGLPNEKLRGDLLVLGGGDGVALAKALEYGPRSVELLEIDKEVLTASREHLTNLNKGALEDPRAVFVFEDALIYLQEDRGKTFDCVLYDMSMHPEAFTVLGRFEYLDVFFGHLKRKLNPGAAAAFQVGSKHDRQTMENTRALLEKHFGEIRYEERFLPSFCEVWVFAFTVCDRQTQSPEYIAESF